MTPEAALAALRAAGDPERAPGMAAYHKAGRVYYGTALPEVNALVKSWRAALSSEERLPLADALWQSDVHEARIAAAKLLTQARIRPPEAEQATWQMIETWVPQFDGWAIADHACSAGGRRVMADLSRLDAIEAWIASDHLWTKRAAFVITLPLAHLNFPSPDQLAARERVLGWAATSTMDRQRFIQKAMAWWLRDLSKHDAARVRAFLSAHGETMKGFARKEAAKYL
ncbi:DNA alkylation repair protein [Sagittula sp. M10.9X]|uniref:DNA alkylation repair protein n=1 Tax=Sagittula salina TaxID=2820268 RepID=A0A940MI35_9RHOB|nr:DNA alkylation repair protein [Sagittula salina]